MKIFIALIASAGKVLRFYLQKVKKHPLYTVRYGSYGNSVQIKRKMHPASFNLKCDSKRSRKLRILTVNALCFSQYKYQISFIWMLVDDKSMWLKTLACKLRFFSCQGKLKLRWLLEHWRR